jgi:aspartate oxidase
VGAGQAAPKLTMIQSASGLFLTDAYFQDRQFIAEHAQDVSAVFNSNEDIRKNSDEDWNKAGNMKLVARVPQVVWLMWESMGITDDPQELLKALERNAEWKTTEKQLI